ncbi:5, 10-methenyltetrahydrofolate synthetase-like protein [Polychytrium aggregatum]|uniref:5, 10-methenyltetrahydrofolate synthetase-like protein n=1 Tax=Polychytrium aggregatum TaxID=110093 RepID=UPI0022FF0360|nr:5, 10-methenyltetrahydrofolate synthetase-like protein [Polychytrium aggregatum]KAI9204072.1 5, 10-methenyltetrahydrofolate synthetase-like protein [Polychytrium aggregatum]
MSALKQMKVALRKEWKNVVPTLSDAVVAEESAKVAARLWMLPQYRRAQNVCVYISMKGEISTQGIIEALFAEGKNCYIPRWHGDVMDMVKLKSLEDYRSLPLNRWNIPEPDHSEVRENALEANGLDLIIMPGVYFDKEGWRLGHGKGYYDRYLDTCEAFARSRSIEKPFTVALALSAQILATGTVPRDTHDRKPDLVLAPDVELGQ